MKLIYPKGYTFSCKCFIREIFKNTSNLGSEITLDKTDLINAGVTFILMDGLPVEKPKNEADPS